MSKEKELYLIILYYKYIHIEDPNSFRDFQIKICSKLNLLGRIIVSYEGINGTLSGSNKNIAEYMTCLKKIKSFEDIDFKISTYHKHVFPKLSVKLKKK